MTASAGPVTGTFFDWHSRRISAPRAARIAEALARRVGPQTSLLDVGAGDGVLALEIARLTGASRVLGVDVLLQPRPAIDIAHYDGLTLPFPDRSIDVVILSDVLHHAASPEPLLREALRVCRRAVALKDHLSFGRLSSAILLAMDLVGNAAASVPSPGVYLTAIEWCALIDRVGGRFESIEWPLRIHDAPFRWITRDEHHFAAAIVRRDAPHLDPHNP